MGAGGLPPPRRGCPGPVLIGLGLCIQTQAPLLLPEPQGPEVTHPPPALQLRSCGQETNSELRRAPGLPGRLGRPHPTPGAWASSPKGDPGQPSPIASAVFCVIARVPWAQRRHRQSLPARALLGQTGQWAALSSSGPDEMDPSQGHAPGRRVHFTALRDEQAGSPQVTELTVALVLLALGMGTQAA